MGLIRSLTCVSEPTMAKTKLTDGIVANTPAGAKDVILWDETLARFGVRISPTGGRFYFVQYRVKGAAGEGSTTRRVPIGKHDGRLWNLTKARAEARRILAPVDLGRDPFAERQAERERAKAEAQARAEAEAAAVKETERRARETVAVQVARYTEARLAKRRSGGEAARLLKHGPVAAWGSRHVTEVTKADVAELLDTIAKRAPGVARATFAELRTFYDWCAERGLVAASPCAYVTAPPRPAARDRVLTEDELRLVWRAAEGLGFPFGPAIKLLILTGQRRAEVGDMAWHELDTEAGVWRIPAERTKNKLAHEVDLSPEALAVIRAVRDLKIGGPYVFPGRKTGGGLRGWSAVKRKLDTAIEDLRAQDAAKAGEAPPAKPMAAWRLHDLRRTAATGMAAMDIRPEVVERVLNHVSGVRSGLVGVYQHHEYRPDRKAALTAWGARVASVVDRRPLPSNVVPLRA